MANKKELSRDLIEALNHSIDLLNKGEGLERCLSLYPGLRNELEPLLQVAVGLQGIKEEEISLEFRNKVKQEIFRRYNRRAVRAASKLSHIFSWSPRWAVAASVAVFVLFGTGAVKAAADSLPDNPLYNVKRASEEVQLALFTTSPISKARLHAYLADRRAKELREMMRHNDSQHVEMLASMMNHHLDQAVILTWEAEGGNVIEIVDYVSPSQLPNSPFNTELKRQMPSLKQRTLPRRLSPEAQRLRSLLRRNFDTHQALLDKAMLNATPKNQPFVRRVISENRLNYLRAMQYLELLGSGD